MKQGGEKKRGERRGETGSPGPGRTEEGRERERETGDLRLGRKARRNAPKKGDGGRRGSAAQEANAGPKTRPKRARGTI